MGSKYDFYLASWVKRMLQQFTLNEDDLKGSSNLQQLPNKVMVPYILYYIHKKLVHWGGLHPRHPGNSSVIWNSEEKQVRYHEQLTAINWVPNGNQVQYPPLLHQS